MQSRIILHQMKFRAFHGCYPEEQINGNDFVVHISFRYNSMQAALSDDLTHSIDYTRVYAVVHEIMGIPVKLLEHLAAKILRRLEHDFPEAVDWKIRIEKLHPPIDNADIAYVAVELCSSL